MTKLRKVILIILGVGLSINVNTSAKQIPSPEVPSNVRLVGTAKDIVFIPGDEPFLMGEDMLPGDRLKRTMIIENKYTVPYALYLKASRISPIPDDGYDLLKKLNLKITYKGKTLYNRSISEEDGILNDIYLGTYSVNQEEVLDAEVYFKPGDDDNYYKNKYEEVKWIFTAVNSNSPENPDPINPAPENPDPVNPDPENPDPVNPDPENPDPENPDPENPDPENPDPENPDPGNPDPANPSGTDSVNPGAGENGESGVNGTNYFDGMNGISYMGRNNHNLGSQEKGEYVKTGDNKSLYIIISILTVSGVTLILMLRRRKNYEN